MTFGFSTLTKDQDGDTVMSDEESVSPMHIPSSPDWPRVIVESHGKECPSKAGQYSSGNKQINQRSPYSTSSLFAFSPSSPDAKTSALKYWSRSARHVEIPRPPIKPLSWIWECHVCRNRYPLHVTRRCLNDGHYYCSGDANADSQRSVKRKKRGQSCSSEFDYAGWTDWDSWRRKALALKAYANGKAAPVLKGCENCDFPSQCRYEKRAFTEVLLPEKYLDLTDKLREDGRNVLQEIKTERDTTTSAGDQKSMKKAKNKKRSSAKTGSEQKFSSTNTFEREGEKCRFYSNASNILSSTDLISPIHEDSTQDSMDELKLIEQAPPYTSLEAEGTSCEEDQLEERKRDDTFEKQISDKSKAHAHDKSALNPFITPVTITRVKKLHRHQSLLTEFFKEGWSTRSHATTYSKSSSTVFSSSICDVGDGIKPSKESKVTASMQSLSKNSGETDQTHRSSFNEPDSLDPVPLSTALDKRKEPNPSESQLPDAISHSAFQPMDDFQFDFELTEAPYTTASHFPTSHSTETEKLEQRSRHESVAKISGGAIASGSSRTSRWKKRRHQSHNNMEWEDIGLAQPH